jgi:hypothetical protein
LIVTVTNRSNRPCFVLKEAWSGGVILLESAERLIVAHHAFTADRSLELGGGILTREVFAPEFYEVKAGATVELTYGIPEKLDKGIWTLDAYVSLVWNIPDKIIEGGASELSRLDTVIACSGETISIPRKSPDEPERGDGLSVLPHNRRGIEAEGGGCTGPRVP